MALKNIVYIESKNGQTAEQRYNTLVSTGVLGTHTYDPDNDYRIEESGGSGYTAGDNIVISNNEISVSHTPIFNGDAQFLGNVTIPLTAMSKIMQAPHITAGMDLTVSNPQAIKFAADESTLDSKLSGKQEILVSGTNIKTIGGQSVLGSGNISTITAEEVDTKIAAAIGTAIGGTY